MLNFLKNNKLFKRLAKKSKNLTWAEMLGISAFFFIIFIAFLLFTRKSEDITITVRLLNSNNYISYSNFPRQMFIENLKKGLKEKGQLGTTVVEIMDVYRYPSSDVNQDVFVILKIKSIYNKRTGQYSYDNLPLLIGDYRTFKLENVTFSGVVVDINTNAINKDLKKFVIKGFFDPANNNNLVAQQSNLNGVTADGIKDYLANQIVPNLKITDSDGVVKAEITSVQKTNGKISLIENGNFVTVEDPTTKHVEVTMDILADKVGDSYFFQNEQILTIGNNLFLSFPNLRIMLTITSITPGT